MLYVININRLRQRHSVLIMSKFISPTHLFMHVRHSQVGRMQRQTTLPVVAAVGTPAMLSIYSIVTYTIVLAHEF